MSGDATKPAAPRRRSLALRNAALLLLLALVGVAAWAWLRAGATPTWWSPPDPLSEPIADLGYATEMAVLEQLHDIRRATERWSIRLTDEEINAWFMVNLPAWYEHEVGREWPDDVGPPQVHAQAGSLLVGVRLPGQLGDRVLSLTLRPALAAGRLRCALEGAALGRLSIPSRSAAIDWLSSAAGSDDNARAVLDVLTGRESVDPVLELSDGRRVRVTGIELSEGTLALECETLPRAARESGDDDR